MKEKKYFLNHLLAILWGSLMAGFVVCRTFYPPIILPALDIPLLLAVSLAALLLEYLLNFERNRPWIAMMVLAALTYGFLPFCAGLIGSAAAVKLALIGSILFFVTTVLFDSVIQRLASSHSTKAAPILAAFVLFLAGQCFTNIFF